LASGYMGVILQDYILSPFEGEEDYPLYCSLVFNTAVMEMNLGRVFTEEEAKEYYAFMTFPQENTRCGSYKVLLPTGEFIGMCAIVFNEPFACPEVEYMLLPEYWGRGRGTKLLKQMMEMLLHNPDYSEIIAITAPDNERSRRMLLRYGFFSDCVYTNHDGSKAEVFVYELDT